MDTTTLNAEQAFEIAKKYYELAVEVGNYRFQHWNDLNEGERRELEDAEWTLSNYSSDFNYRSIVLLVNAAETKKAVAGIKSSTEKMTAAIASLNNIRKVIKIVTAAVTLGAAIITGHPLAIGEAILGVAAAVAPEG